MAVHAFFTGVRGVIAPIIAFQLISRLPIGEIGIICVVLIGLASLILLPEMKRAMRRTVPTQPIRRDVPLERLYDNVTARSIAHARGRH